MYEYLLLISGGHWNLQANIYLAHKVCENHQAYESDRGQDVCPGSGSSCQGIHDEPPFNLAWKDQEPAQLLNTVSGLVTPPKKANQILGSRQTAFPLAFWIKLQKLM